MKIAYCGYDFFWSCLERIIDLKHEVVEIFTFVTDDKWNFNRRVLEMAARERIRVSFSRITADDLSRLSAKGVEALVVAGYPYRLPVPSFPAINVHPSLLPEGRGRWPLPWQILLGKDAGGVTIHKIDSDFDTGAILAQEQFPLASDETLESISCKSQLVAANMLQVVLADFGRFLAEAREQKGGSYWEFPSDELQTLDWSLPVAAIDARVRAFGCMETTAVVGDCRYSVVAASCWPERHSYTVGSIVHKTNKELVVAASDGLVCLRVFTRE